MLQELPDEANRVAVVPIVVVHVHVARIEVHVVRVVLVVLVGSTRPVVAVRAGIVHVRTVAVACGGEEDSARAASAARFLCGGGNLRVYEPTAMSVLSCRLCGRPAACGFSLLYSSVSHIIFAIRDFSSIMNDIVSMGDFCSMGYDSTS